MKVDIKKLKKDLDFNTEIMFQYEPNTGKESYRRDWLERNLKDYIVLDSFDFGRISKALKDFNYNDYYFEL